MRNIFLIFFVSLKLFAITQSECESITANGGAVWDDYSNDCLCNDTPGFGNLLASDGCVYFKQSELDYCDSLGSDKATWDLYNHECVCNDAAFNVDNGCDCAVGYHFDSAQNVCVQDQSCTDVDLMQYVNNCTSAGGHMIELPTCDDSTGILDVNQGTCLTCGSGYTFNADTNACDPVVCPTGQHALTDGTCVDDCTVLQIEQSDGTCVDKTCPSGQQLDQNGVCQNICNSSQYYDPATNTCNEKVNDFNIITPKQYIGECTHYCFTGASGSLNAVYSRQAPIDLNGTSLSCSGFTFEKVNFTVGSDWTHWNCQYVSNSSPAYCNFVIGLTNQGYDNPDGTPSSLECGTITNDSLSISFGNGVNWLEIDGFAVDYCGDGNLQSCTVLPDINTSTSALNDINLSGVTSRLDELKAQALQTNTKLDGIDTKIGLGNSKLDSIASNINTTNSKLDGIASNINTTNSKLDGVNFNLNTLNTNVQSSINTNINIGNAVNDNLVNLKDTIHSDLNQTNSLLSEIAGSLKSDANVSNDANLTTDGMWGTIKTQITSAISSYTDNPLGLGSGSSSSLDVQPITMTILNHSFTLLDSDMLSVIPRDTFANILMFIAAIGGFRSFLKN